jgi:hypothetical protein
MISIDSAVPGGPISQVFSGQKRENHGAHDLFAFDEERAQFGFNSAQLLK